VAEHCSAVYLIGQAAPRLRSALEGTVPRRDGGDLETALARAAEAAQPGDTVLLSPACASYDQFANYERRGDRFRELVAGLA
jgi:UDP-N-acetylmuramoylalanine--D-glutamate ligase